MTPQSCAGVKLPPTKESERRQGAPRTRSAENSKGLLLTLLCASTLTVMSSASISAALPSLSRHFGDSLHADFLSRLLLTVPALFIAACSPIAGALMDRIGRKRVLVFGTTLYITAGSAGLLVSSFPALFASRVILGIGIAAIATAVPTLVGSYFSELSRSKIAGYQGAFSSFGGVLFVGIGSVLANLSWRGPFAVYALALPILICQFIYVFEPTHGGVRSTVPTGQKTGQGRTWFLFPLMGIGMVVFYLGPTQLPFHMRTLGVEKPFSQGLPVILGTPLRERSPPWLMVGSSGAFHTISCSAWPSCSWVRDM